MLQSNQSAAVPSVMQPITTSTSSEVLRPHMYVTKESVDSNIMSLELSVKEKAASATSAPATQARFFYSPGHCTWDNSPKLAENSMNSSHLDQRPQSRKAVWCKVPPQGNQKSVHSLPKDTLCLGQELLVWHTACCQ